MIERAYLHLGLAKTATTAIQQSLATHRERLLEQRTLFPSFATNHFAMTYVVSDPPERLYSPHFKDGVTTAEEWVRKGGEIDADFRAEIDAHKPAQLVLSAEAFSNWPSEALSRLRDYAQKFAKSVTAIVYLRDPLDWQTSNVMQRLRGGERLSEIALQPFPLEDRLTDFQRIFAEVDIRLFENARQNERRIVGDFLEAIGVAADIPAAPIENVGSNLEQALIFDRINAHFPPMSEDRSGPNPKRDRHLVGWLRHVTGARFDISATALKANAEAYRKQYQWLNEHVPATRGIYCFPEEMPAPNQYSLEDAFDQACRLINLIALERSRLGGEVLKSWRDEAKRRNEELQLWKDKYNALARTLKAEQVKRGKRRKKWR